MQNAEDLNTEGEVESFRYFLRSRCKKRPVLPDEPDTAISRKRIKLDDGSCTVINDVIEICPINNLPADILNKIFAYFSYQELSTNIRGVCRKFRDVAGGLLNSNFKKTGKKVKNLLNYIQTILHLAEGDIEVKCYCRLVNMLEIVNFQHSVIKATIWRYVFNDRYQMYKTSMYGGKILDIYENFLRKFTGNPDQLTAGIIGRDYLMPAEVNTIVLLTKNFCLHFERVNEESINHNLMVSGCKILDLLDNAIYANKDVVYEKVDNDVYSARYSYFFRNTWFVAMNINTEKQMTWRQKQRMMHMRIRRIMIAHTDMLMQQHQYEREAAMRKNDNNFLSFLRKPNSNVYTGYGDIQDKFFFYGVMNDEAYVQKFHPEDSILEDTEMQTEFGENMSFFTDEDYAKVPYLGIHIDVKVRCPLSRAPLNYLEKNYPLDLQDWSYNEKKGGKKFYLKMSFECEGAIYPRLPTKYEYNFKQM